MLRKLLLTLIAAGVTWAGTTYDSISGKDMVELLQTAGYKAELTEDNTGDPKVKTKMGGLNCSIYFFGCEGAKGEKECSSYQFYAGFEHKLDDAKIIEWNGNKRYARCYPDEDGNVRIEYDEGVEGGVKSEYILKSFDRWEVILNDFSKFIGW